MYAITAATQEVHLDWHAAGERPRLERAYSGGGLHFLVIITDEEALGNLSILGHPRR